MLFIKLIILVFPHTCYTETEPSFSFSLKEGLRQISSAEESDSNKKEKNELSPLLEENSEEIGDEPTQVETVIPSIESTQPETDKKDSSSISSSFAPEEPEHIKGTSFLDSFIDNSSWFFQKKHSTHKIG
ncbi:MAG: hypothetical protein OXC37_01615, partial [Bdellovibrionaceae bacterium]|nr:hypothetical protein [Pseudobdellovibrionaceae bacterium]